MQLEKEKHWKERKEFEIAVDGNNSDDNLDLNVLDGISGSVRGSQSSVPGSIPSLLGLKAKPSDCDTNFLPLCQCRVTRRCLAATEFSIFQEEDMVATVNVLYLDNFNLIVKDFIQQHNNASL